MTTIKLEFDICSFAVPTTVLFRWVPRPRQGGFHQHEPIPLADVPADVLSAMCDEFRAGVFSRAGKDDPRQHGEVTP